MKNMNVYVFCLLAFFMFRCPADDQLIAAWDFTQGTIHSTDNMVIPMYLRGSTRLVSSPEGSFLSIGNTPAGKPQGARSKGIHEKLAPRGAFRIEIKFRLRDTPSQKRIQRLFDMKNVNYNGKNPDWHKGFLLELTQMNKDSYRIYISLGFGNGESENCCSGNLTLLPGKIYTAAAEYNGKNAVTFLLDGKIIWKAALKKTHGAIAPPVNPVVIGDRVGSSYQPFNGDIFSVKLYDVIPAPEISINRRRAFYRNWPGESLKFVVSNPSGEVFSDITVSGNKLPLPDGKIKIPALAPKAEQTVALPVETRLKKGRYPAEIKIRYCVRGIARETKFTPEILICPEPKDIMPIEFELAPDAYYIPVTHVLQQLSTVYYKYNSNKPLIESFYRRMDELMYAGYFVMDLCYTGKMPNFIKKYPRMDRGGKPRPQKNLDASNPEFRAMTEEFIRKTAETFGDHPVFTGAIINSEVRDSTAPSFTSYNIQAYKKYSGQEIPEKANEKLPPSYVHQPDFPASRIVNENNPLLKFYSWFWKTGDGWNDYQSLIAETYRKGIKRNFNSEFHPAVRVPPLWGSGGKVSWISHWTYVNPNPINIGVNTDELQAMARGTPGQKVKTMTTMIVYRSAVAPKGENRQEPAWVKEFPDARYITAPPDMIQEALFVQLSRHVEGISFHGYDTLDRRKKPMHSIYKNTNSQTKIVLADFLNKVVVPYGPVLKRLKERKMQMAVLESFASTIFANRGTWGSAGWSFNFQMLLQWANLPVKVIYEEEILRSGLKDIDILFMPWCDVLPEKVFLAIAEFQRRGGIVVSDQYHVPGLLPDLVVPYIAPNRKPDVNKKNCQIEALKLKNQLRDYYTPYADSSNPDLLVRVRSDKESDYLFVINDKRTFGDYVGQYGLIMEKGLPNSGTVSVRRKCQVIYDLLTGKTVSFSVKDGITVIPVNFRTNDGKILLLMDSPVTAVELQMAEKAEKGGTVPFSVRLKTADGKYLKALHPLRVEVRDPKNVLTDDSTWAALTDGVYKSRITIPLNGEQGLWNVTVRDPASGKSAVGKLQVQ